MAGPLKDNLTMEPARLAAIVAELEVALDELEQLAHLCSVQARASRVEEAVSAALYMLRATEPLRQQGQRR